jgi:hypothetical protein
MLCREIDYIEFMGVTTKLYTVDICTDHCISVNDSELGMSYLERKLFYK